MTNKLFQMLGIAGLKEATPADAFADLPASDPGYRQAGGASDGSGGHDVLDLLHQEFRQVLADPWQLVGRAHARPGPIYPAWRAPVADAEPSASGSVHLLAAVLPQESLDGFITRFVASLDPGEEPTLLVESRPEEVLQLFAPLLAAARHAPLPLTTRRDHHALSPDSAVQIGVFAAAVEPWPPSPPRPSSIQDTLP